MASYQHSPRNGTARFHFRFRGRQYTRVEKVESERHAARTAAAIEETILDIEKGRLKLPPDADPKTFILTGGRLDRPQNASGHASQATTVSEVFKTYFGTLTTDFKAESTIKTEKTHSRSFARVLGDKVRLDEFSLDVAQRYVDRRVQDKVVRDTIAKELVTILFVWKWACKRKIVSCSPAWKISDVTLPKGKDRPPFQTWSQIEWMIERDGLTPEQQDECWETLWLTQEQTMECLEWVKRHPRRPFVYPMFAFAAYTGARRGELIRSRREDWEFNQGVVRIRQKKANRSKTFTFREVSIHPDLAFIMRDWFESTPNMTYAVSSTGRRLPLSESTKWFRKTVEPAKWSVLRGWHVFRHSLASNMAASGIDQRIINATLGHSTSAMARRYSHLLPSKQGDAIHSLFSKPERQPEDRGSDTP